MTIEPSRWTVPGWNAIPGLVHGFFGRAGGVSGDDFESLNCSEHVGDDPASVHENRRRATRSLGVDRLVLSRQMHGDRIVRAEFDAPGVEEADGLVARTPCMAVGVLTADCVPLLLVVPEAGMVAAIHAGWKGTRLGIARRALEILCVESGLPAAAVHAALGPAIGGCCYEVGEEVVAALQQGASAGCVRILRRRGAKAWIDLREINAAILRRGGVRESNIHLVGPCTRCAAAECFSHRASGGRTGRQLSAIGWRAEQG